MSFVYFISEAAGGPVKIGRGVDPSARLSELQVGNHRELVLLGAVKEHDGLEGHLHDRFWLSRLRGEWFARTPELIDYIAENADRWENLNPRRPLLAIDPAPEFSADRLEQIDAIGERMRNLVRDPLE